MTQKNEEEIGDALLRALERVLTPLVRIMLRYGVTYRAFEQVVRRVFIDVATRDFEIPGRKLSASRIAVLTGLSRRDVARYRDHPLPQDRGDEDRVNRAARVISGWRSDPDFLDGSGRPKTLPFEDAPLSFLALVHRHAGDVPARALLDELLRVDAVEPLKDGRLRLIARAYVTGAPDADTVTILATHAPELIETIAHNLEARPEDKLFQRRVFFSGIPAHRSVDVRALVSDRGQALLEKLHADIEKIADQDSEKEQSGSIRVVLGMHYFEEPEETEESDED
jgi:hypothetical protein